MVINYYKHCHTITLPRFSHMLQLTSAKEHSYMLLNYDLANLDNKDTCKHIGCMTIFNLHWQMGARIGGASRKRSLSSKLRSQK